MRDNLSLYSLDERIFFVKCFYKNNSDINCVKNMYLLEYGAIDDIPNDTVILGVISLFEKKGNIADVPNENDLNIYIKNEEQNDESYTENEIYLDDAKVESKNFALDPFWSLDDSEIKYKTTLSKITGNDDDTSNESNLQLAPTITTKTKERIIHTKQEIDQNETHFEYYDGDEKETKVLGKEKLVPQPKLCKFCHKIIPSRYQLRRHIKENHANDKPIFVQKVYKNPTPCRFCSLIFSGKHSRRLHYRKEHPEEHDHYLKTYKFGTCKTEIQNTNMNLDEGDIKIENAVIDASKIDTERTTNKRKTLPKPALCKYCKEMIPSKYQLRLHIKKVHLNEQAVYENPVLCKYCPEIFPNKSRRNTHIRIDHPVEHSMIVQAYSKTPEALRTCHFCGKVCCRPSRLIKHIRTHTGESEAVCDVCGKGYNSLACLRRHMLVHTGEKPFQCEFSGCNKSFNNKNGWILHNRTHTGEKPFKCETCGKCFKDASTRRVHYRQHTGENPYSCEICGKTTKQKQNLRSHMKHFHKINNWNK